MPPYGSFALSIVFLSNRILPMSPKIGLPTEPNIQINPLVLTYLEDTSVSFDRSFFWGNKKWVLRNWVGGGELLCLIWRNRPKEKLISSACHLVASSGRVLHLSRNSPASADGVERDWVWRFQSQGCLWVFLRTKALRPSSCVLFSPAAFLPLPLIIPLIFLEPSYFFLLSSMVSLWISDLIFSVPWNFLLVSIWKLEMRTWVSHQLVAPPGLAD